MAVAGNPRQFDIGWDFLKDVHLGGGAYQVVVPHPPRPTQICIEKVSMYINGGIGLRFFLMVRIGSVAEVIFEHTTVNSNGLEFRGPIVIEGTGDATTQSDFGVIQQGNTTPFSFDISAEWVRR